MEFSAYLWGIETQISGQGDPGVRGFSAYLWGIETETYKRYDEQRGSSQPTYEELKRNSLRWSLIQPCIVLSLPMRNWNTKNRAKSSGSMCSQPTYEELKPVAIEERTVDATPGSQPTYEELKQRPGGGA